MKYTSTLLAVTDMEKSKKFYQDVLQLDILADFGANVTLSGGIALQTLETWQDFIHTDINNIRFGSSTFELYFEEDDMDSFLQRIHSVPIQYIHPLKEHSWGQKVIRFYDPDQHIIEVGENMEIVVKRFLDSGMTTAETAIRMDVPIEYVASFGETKKER